MARYLLDTGIIVGYLRRASYAEYVDKTYSPFESPNVPAMSIVSVGELLSLAIQFGWGVDKKEELKKHLQKIPHVDIKNESIFSMYAEIDSYSQGKNPSKRLPSGLTSRNMGKNDLWIAATASVINAKLITTDQDFQHLDGNFLAVIYIDPGTKP